MAERKRLKQRRLNKIDPTREGRVKLSEMRDIVELEELMGRELEEEDMLTLEELQQQEMSELDDSDMIDSVDQIVSPESQLGSGLLSREDVLSNRDQIQQAPIPGFGLPPLDEKAKKLKMIDLFKNNPKLNIGDTEDSGLDDIIKSALSAGFTEDLSADALQADIIAGIGERFRGERPSLSLTKSGQFRGTGSGLADRLIAHKTNQARLSAASKLKAALEQQKLGINQSRILQQQEAARLRNEGLLQRLEAKKKSQFIKSASKQFKTANSSIISSMGKLEVLDDNGNFKRFNTKIEGAEEKHMRLRQMLDRNNRAHLNFMKSAFGMKISPEFATDKGASILKESMDE